MDLSPEAWGVVSAVTTGLLGVWVEVVRRTAKSGREESTKKQDEIIKQTAPIANGFADSVKRMLSEVLSEMHNVKLDMKDVQDSMRTVKESQVDLHRRLDHHLEDHVAKQRRSWFR
jgi:ribosomal protein L24